MGYVYNIIFFVVKIQILCDAEHRNGLVLVFCAA
jgi:hypothetical protein